MSAKALTQECIWFILGIEQWPSSGAEWRGGGGNVRADRLGQTKQHLAGYDESLHLECYGKSLEGEIDKLIGFQRYCICH